MTRRKDVTIYDIAERAGVSASTVSRVFSSPARVSPATAAKVHQIARELGYASQSPSYWETDDKNALGFLIRNFANPAYSDILHGFQDAAAEQDYSVIVATAREARDEAKSVERILPLVDGIAFPGSRLPTSMLKQIERVHPLVMISRYAVGHSCVVSDTRGGMKLVGEHLAALGHSQIVYLSGSESSWANAARWHMLEEACEEMSLKLTKISVDAIGIEAGQLAAQAWLDHPVSAVVAFNDQRAMGFMHAVMRAGYSVPDDVSVVGIDNSPVTAISTPALTSLASGGYELGRRAADNLIWQAKHRSQRQPTTITLPTELTVRESTGPAPRRLAQPTTPRRG